jgi:hypothetical protein
MMLSFGAKKRQGPAAVSPGISSLVEAFKAAALSSASRNCGRRAGSPAESQIGHDHQNHTARAPNDVASANRCTTLTHRLVRASKFSTLIVRYPTTAKSKLSISVASSASAFELSTPLRHWPTATMVCWLTTKPFNTAAVSATPAAWRC